MEKKEINLCFTRQIIERIAVQAALHSSLLAVETAIQHGPHEVFEYTGIMAANTDAAGVLKDELKALTKALSAQAKSINPQTNANLKKQLKNQERGING